MVRTTTEVLWEHSKGAFNLGQWASQRPSWRRSSLKGMGGKSGGIMATVVAFSGTTSYLGSVLMVERWQIINGLVWQAKEFKLYPNSSGKPWISFMPVTWHNQFLLLSTSLWQRSENERDKMNMVVFQVCKKWWETELGCKRDRFGRHLVQDSTRLGDTGSQE